MIGKFHRTLRFEIPLNERHIPSDGINTSSISLQSRTEMMEATRTGEPNICHALMTMITTIIGTVGAIAIAMCLSMPVRSIHADTFLPIVGNMVIFTEATIRSMKLNISWNLLEKKTFTNIMSRMFSLRL